MGLDHTLYYNNTCIIDWRKQYWIVEVLNKLGNLKEREDNEEDSEYTFGLVEFYAFRDFCKLCLEYPQLRELIVTCTTHNAIISLDELKRTVIILDDFVRFAHPTHDGEFTHILYW